MVQSLVLSSSYSWEALQCQKVNLYPEPSFTQEVFCPLYLSTKFQYQQHLTFIPSYRVEEINFTLNLAPWTEHIE